MKFNIIIGQRKILNNIGLSSNNVKFHLILLYVIWPIQCQNSHKKQSLSLEVALKYHYLFIY